MGRRQCGQVWAMVVVGMLALMVAGAMVVDLSIAVVAKQQLQTAADAAALAGVAMLQTTLDEAAARDAAVAMARANSVVGKGLTLDPEVDVVVGALNPETNEIVPFDVTDDGAVTVPDGPVAVRVVARRGPDAPDGPVRLFFAGMFGIGSVSMRAEATAGLTISRRPRPSVEVAIVQDQSGSFEDEFPYAREGDCELVGFLRDSYVDGDKAGFIGFGYHPYHADTSSPKRRDIWVHHDYALNSTEDTEDGAQATIDYISNVPTVPYYHYPEKYCFTNLYTGMLKSMLAFAEPEVAEQAWADFVDSLYYNGTYRNIGWWRRNNYEALKRKMQRLFDVPFANIEANHVVVIVSDGMPWYHENSFPDWRSNDLCQYIADKMADLNVRIHTVTLCQNDEPPDGSAGADAQFMARLVRNGGYAFYTYDAQRLADLLVGVGQIEVGQARLIH